jgi:hypothetical protein
MRHALAALAIALAAPAGAADLIAVPDLDFADSSGEVGDQAEDHAARLVRFTEALRAELVASGAAEVVLPACAEPCSPAQTPFATMAEASRSAGAERLLVGNVHKISTLIGSVKLTLIDLPGDRVLCTRVLSYRGDTDEAWDRAARFAAEDVVRHCLP